MGGGLVQIIYNGSDEWLLLMATIHGISGARLLSFNYRSLVNHEITLVGSEKYTEVYSSLYYTVDEQIR